MYFTFFNFISTSLLHFRDMGNFLYSALLLLYTQNTNNTHIVNAISAHKRTKIDCSLITIGPYYRNFYFFIKKNIVIYSNYSYNLQFNSSASLKMQSISPSHTIISLTQISTLRLLLLTAFGHLKSH